MTQENTVSFKVFLQNEGLNEVRRFGVDRDVVANFNYLKGKLQSVFPSLQGKDFTVAWKDLEGDEVIISSDDELIIALTEQQADVRKLFVTAKPGRAQPPQAAAGEGTRQHVGVTCDGCNKGVEGFRYKCIQCPDYDLCTACEGKGLHAEHYMIRMPVPTFWRPHFGKRLAHHLSKAAHKGGRCGGWEGFEGGEPGHCPFNRHGGRHHHGGRNNHGGPGWLENLASYLNDWTLPGDEDMDTKEDATAAAGPSSSKQQKTKSKEDAHVQYLRNIGKTVANLLDPLGIDVDVEVRTKDKSDKAGKEEEGKETKTAAEGHSSSSSSSSSAMEVDDKQEKEASSPRRADRSQSVEVEEWTVVNKESSPQQGDQSAQNETATASGAVPTAETGAVPKQPLVTTAATTSTTTTAASSTGSNMYPNMFGHVQFPQFQHGVRPPFNMFPAAPYMPTPLTPQQPLMPGAPAAPTPGFVPHPPHIRPHVAEAVDKMISMGFSNDGGWLTQLLDSKDGDIIKALDVLQPVKK